MTCTEEVTSYEWQRLCMAGSGSHRQAMCIGAPALQEAWHSASIDQHVPFGLSQPQHAVQVLSRPATLACMHACDQLYLYLLPVFMSVQYPRLRHAPAT